MKLKGYIVNWKDLFAFQSPDGYLEALTNAYIKSGILVSDQQAKGGCPNCT